MGRGKLAVQSPVNLGLTTTEDSTAGDD